MYEYLNNRTSRDIDTFGVFYIKVGDKLLKMGICDDNKMFCSCLEADIMHYETKMNRNVSIEVFYSGESLIHSMEQDELFDAVFLDIQLSGKDGVMVGSYIRNILRNDDIQIVYISAKTNYALKLFDNRPLNFLMKPYNQKKLYDVIETLHRLLGKKEDYYTFAVGHATKRVPLKDILYFESVEKRVRIVMTDAEEMFYGKMKEVEQVLSNQNFICIHKSYFVNVKHIIKYEYNQITMSNNDVLPISQSNRSKIRKYNLKYMKEQLLS